MQTFQIKNIIQFLICEIIVIHHNPSDVNWPQIVALHFETSVIPSWIAKNTFLQRCHLLFRNIYGQNDYKGISGLLGLAAGCFGEDIQRCAGPSHAQCGRLSTGFNISQGVHEGRVKRILRTASLSTVQNGWDKSILFFCKGFSFDA